MDKETQPYRLRCKPERVMTMTITISNLTVAQNTPAGTIVGVLTASDARQNSAWVGVGTTAPVEGAPPTPTAITVSPAGATIPDNSSAGTFGATANVPCRTALNLRPSADAGAL
jgi:hypothetical protein